nr:MAG TPA: hypothetical protein [Caudoviricetes sp.]
MIVSVVMSNKKCKLILLSFLIIIAKKKIYIN